MASKIIVRHSSIIINNYKRGDCEKIENMMSVWDPGYFCMKPIAYYIDEENNKLYLPRGIDISYVEKLFDSKAEMDYKCDSYKNTNNPIMIKYMPRDDVQKEALRFLLGKGEYFSMTRKSQQSLNLSTGKGKTYCSIATIACCNIKSAIITYSIGWLNQWKNCFIEYTDLKDRNIKIVNSSATISTFLKNPEKAEKYDIFLFSHNTLKSYGDTFGWDKISELFKILGIGLKFYDEAHLNFTNMCMIDFFTDTYKTYYVSASPARSNDEENRIFKLYFKNIPGIELFDADNDPHTSYVCFKYDSKPTPRQKSACGNKYGLSLTGYSDYVVNQPNFLKMIDIILDMARTVKGKCLIYMATNKSIQALYNYIMNIYPELQNDVGIYTSLTDGPDKKDNLNRKIILSTIKSCGTAMDIKGLSMTVIAASPFKSEVLMQQVLGRTRDKNTICIEFIDIAFSQITRFYYNKKHVIEKYALDCSNVKFSQYEIDYRFANIIEERYIRNTMVVTKNHKEPFKLVTRKINKSKPFRLVTIKRKVDG